VVSYSGFRSTILLLFTHSAWALFITPRNCSGVPGGTGSSTSGARR
jgi:hypothetical protein